MYTRHPPPAHLHQREQLLPLARVLVLRPPQPPLRRLPLDQLAVLSLLCPVAGGQRRLQPVLRLPQGQLQSLDGDAVLAAVSAPAAAAALPLPHALLQLVLHAQHVFLPLQVGVLQLLCLGPQRLHHAVQLLGLAVLVQQPVLQRAHLHAGRASERESARGKGQGGRARAKKVGVGDSARASNIILRGVRGARGTYLLIEQLFFRRVLPDLRLHPCGAALVRLALDGQALDDIARSA
jgi:hypothetical protein